MYIVIAGSLSHTLPASAGASAPPATIYTSVRSTSARKNRNNQIQLKNKFKNLIKESILSIQEKYFIQDTVNKERKKYNERVFCYELYHQIRLRQSRFEGLTISGEAVKSEFQFSKLGSKNKTPDLLIHNFGTTVNNEVVFEIKTSINRNSVINGLKKDFITLDLFTDNTTTNIDYKLGIYLLINSDYFDVVKSNEKIYRSIKKIIKKNTRIEVWNIASPKFKDGLLDSSTLTIYDNKTLKEKITV